MDIQLHIQQQLTDRQKHLDLDSLCCLSGKDHGTVKVWARRALADWIGIDLLNWSKDINVCHVCEHNSKNGYCLNPRHFYFGTPKENNDDMHRDNPHVKALCIAALKKSQPKAVQAALASEVRAKKAETMRINKHAQGRRNSQYGTMWITNEFESKKIMKGDPIPDGWRAGRRM